nr:MAG TPA: hypothetical protein [Caudoviricetes sp.]
MINLIFSIFFTSLCQVIQQFFLSNEILISCKLEMVYCQISEYTIIEIGE